jgi:hypothetical protein
MYISEQDTEIKYLLVEYDDDTEMAVADDPDSPQRKMLLTGSPIRVCLNLSFSKAHVPILQELIDSLNET